MFKRILTVAIIFSLLLTANACFERADGEMHNRNESSVCKKQCRTVYTDAALQNVRDNIKKYGWAAEIRDRAVTAAEPYLSAGMEFLWSSVTGQQVPRGYTVGNETGCPVCGTEIYGKFGNYPWIVDPIKKPGKITCPICGGSYPSGQYPDDGTGYIAPDGKKYLFTAYYNHWGVWYTNTGMGPNIVMGGLGALTDAYLYTGDPRYARCGLAILTRVADVYPELDISAYRWEDGYYNSHGMSGLGKAVGSIWESLLVPYMLRAYDAFYDVCDDPELLAFLSEKGSPDSGDLLRQHIENGIVLQVVPAVRSEQIRGNEGMHQNCAALAAVVLNSLPESRQWLDEYVNGNSPGGEYNASGIIPVIQNRVSRDGLGMEASPGYNYLWLSQFSSIAGTLQGYRIDGVSYDLYQNVKYQKMLTGFLPLTTPDGYTPNIGDTGSPGAKGILYTTQDCIRGFVVTGDVRFAQLAMQINGGTEKGLHGSIFDKNPEAVAAAIKKACKKAPESGGSFLAGFGFASLAAGDGEGDLWMYFGRTGSHGHRDTLNIGMHAFGIDILPDLGYPEYADSSPQRTDWISNTVSHNTVVVDKQGQYISEGGVPLLYDSRYPVKVVEVSGREAYTGLPVFTCKRQNILIPADDNFYAVDLFRVDGGQSQLYSLHAAGDAAQVSGVSMQAQTAGSFAGEDIAYAAKYDGSQSWKFTESGFHYLDRVQHSAQIQNTVEVDIALNASRHESTRAGTPYLRVSLLDGFGRLSLADGKPSRRPGNAESYRYLLGEGSFNAGETETVFISILQPYIDRPFIKKASLVNITGAEAGRAYCIRVEHTSGRVDTVFVSEDPDALLQNEYGIRFRGSVGVLAEDAHGKQLFCYLAGGGTQAAELENLRLETPCADGAVTDFTRTMSKTNFITVSGDAFAAAKAGDMLLVDDEAGFLLTGGARKTKNGYELPIGDITLIRGLDETDSSMSTYMYWIAEGDSARIVYSAFR